MNDIEVTFREVIFSIGIIGIALMLGIKIADAIDNHMRDKNAVYTKAVQINNDSLQFNYVFATNYGSTFAYGTLSAIGEAKDENVSGVMSIRRELERYTKHHRTVCEGEGKDCHCHEETYWTWDHQKTDVFSVANVRFIGKVFRFGEFPYRDYNYYKTIPCGYHLRYVYHTMPLQVSGTLFAIIDNHRMNKAEFKPGVTIDKARDAYVSVHHRLVFWIIYMILLIAGVIGFVSLENDWLEDKRY